MKLLLLVAVLLLFFGTAVGALMMYIAYRHNPQGTIHLNGRIDWFQWFNIGFAWALIPYMVALILLIVYSLIKVGSIT